MTILKPQTALGGFALVTLLLVVLGWLSNRLMLRCVNPSEDVEA